MKSVLVFWIVFVSGTVFSQSGAFHLGMGKYSYASHDQFSINFGLEKQLSEIFSLGLNGSFLDRGEKTNIVFNETPPLQFYEVTNTFGGFTATGNLDLYVIGLNKNKFQLHFGVGAGIIAIENDTAYGLAQAYAEERIQISDNLSAGIGYNYGINLNKKEPLQQFYFNLKRHF
jgi:hypothetical protein